ncbi:MULTISPECIES: acyltransferase family protein [Streptomycetaceae]|uniref:Acyltransferase 3 n=1 Tax=Streptantibioticus cattleyicolor (strain ATCC 35852 / DSM 46488 / JCM 4925 / NBRC 14057 / NRRL 8057) TaxID=1003195 RepID=F8K2X1_STREN|nr:MULTISPECIES: acyltransferase [Streptomycetaceae]AEW92456.1 acyltransferase 3 [Streptantibioticus cattleyicolor NRRL 8057 = DSM 46488]MYS57263.1 acyltransferase family protein [Streptomyces sp. SID5468]CCB72820.1 Acyltransferase mdmB [Streptantibioticus cattleyicolor NRRL 8057 = DSM 46488]
MTPADPRTARLPSLTGLRFVAAALVFVFHASFEHFFGDPGAQHGFSALVAKAGWLGVSFFFVLSGFVLAWSAAPGDTARAFWRRRCAKVYPGHLLTAVAAFALLAATGGVFTVGQAVTNLLLIQSWFPQVTMFGSGNPVTWSLSCEVLFYLAFPLLWRGIRRIRPERLWWWAAAMVAVVALLPLVAEALPARPLVSMPDGTSPQWRFWLVYVLPAARLPEFVLGAVLARTVRARRWSPVGPLPATALLVLCYWGATRAPYLYSLTAVTIVPLALLIPAVARADVTGRAGVLGRPPLVRLGELSFALYLVHRLVLMYGHRLLGAGRTWSTPAAVGLVLAFLAVSLLAAWVLYGVVERPATRRWGRRRPVPVTPARDPAPVR